MSGKTKRRMTKIQLRRASHHFGIPWCQPEIAACHLSRRKFRRLRDGSLGMVCVSAACSGSSSPSPSTSTHASCADCGLQLERNREVLRSPAAMARSWANNISSVVAGQIRSALANAGTVKTAQKVLAASTRSDRRVADCGLFL